MGSHSPDSSRHCPTDRHMSILVGTVDAKGVPACCRAVGLISNDDLATVTVFVPMATSRDVIANVAATKRIAVSSTHPPTHLSMQIKGTSTNVRLATDEEESMIRDRVDGLAHSLHLIGIPRRVVRSLNHWPAFAIEIAVDELFEQTPGPHAGNPLR